jgi:hypothetical protein
MKHKQNSWKTIIKEIKSRNERRDNIIRRNNRGKHWNMLGKPILIDNVLNESIRYNEKLVIHRVL